MAPAQVALGEPHLVVSDDEDDYDCCGGGSGSGNVERRIRSPVLQKIPVPPQGLVKPVAVRRPVPVKVARPIPKRATEQFYDEAYRQGIPGYAVNAAIMESHDWHRKWTQQDEEGHTMPTNIGCDYNGVPAQYAYQAPPAAAVEVAPFVESDDNDVVVVDTADAMVLDRMAGARNPSPEWESPSAAGGGEVEFQERKRGRYEAEYEETEHQQQLALHQAVLVQQHQQEGVQQQAAAGGVPLHILWNDDDTRNTTPSSLHQGSADEQEENDNDEEEEDYMVHVAKRPVPVRPPAPAIEDDDDEVEDYQQRPTNLVRPVALRVPRPVIAKLPTASSSGGGIHLIPDCIHANDESSCSKMSAITQASGFSNKSKSGFDFHQTDIREVQPLHIVEDETDSQLRSSFEETLVNRRDALLRALAVSGGDAQAENFVSSVEPLSQVFDQQDLDTRLLTHDMISGNSSSSNNKSVHGTWLTLTKPTFFGNLGENDAGDPMYTLGRMTFDMFSPTNLVCSLQGNFNSIEVVSDEDRKDMLEAGLVPKSLREEVENRDVVLRTYNVITAFTIEPSLADYPDAPNKDVRRPIRGIMTTYGYTLPDPEVPNRHSIWITGGRIEPNNDANDIREWKRLFALHPPKHGMGEKAKLLAVKLLMGATIPDKMNDQDGSMEYSFSRPLGGHGVAYVDVLYLDNSLRVVRGHRGTYFVFSRMQQEDL